MGPLAFLAPAAISLVGNLFGGKKSQSASPAYQALADMGTDRVTRQQALTDLQRFASGRDILTAPDQGEPWWAGGSDIWRRNRATQG